MPVRCLAGSMRSLRRMAHLCLWVVGGTLAGIGVVLLAIADDLDDEQVDEE